MRYSFDDVRFGQTKDGTKIDVALARRPPGLTRRAWYEFAGQLAGQLNGPKCEEGCPGDDTCEHAKVCMCGNYVDAHGMGDGHSPVSMHAYHRFACFPVEGCKP